MGGGQRIFPDRQTPGDQINRRIARVKAQLDPSGGSPTFTLGARVYFQTFDVDDPSDDLVIDPNGNLGVDNRGNVDGSPYGQLSGCAGFDGGICYGVTDSSGIASVNFTVTMQPGDNFVIAASTDRSYLASIAINGTGLQDPGGNQLPTASAKRTDILFVWRRLHIEVDSMRPADGNFILGVIPTGFRIAPNQTREVAVNPSPADPLEVDRFENGRLTVGPNSLRVLSNTATAITVRNATSAAVSVLDSQQFQLFDDDDFNGDDGPAPGDGTLDGDLGLGEDIPFLQHDWLEDSDDRQLNRLADAYVRPKYDIGDNNDATIFFPNVAANDVASLRDLYDFDQISTESDAGFWTVYLLSAYQYVIGEDEDPNNEDPNGNGQMDDLTVGVTDRIPDVMGIRRGYGAVVFFESSSLSECVADHGADFCNLNDTKVHEIGHQLNAEHGDGGIMDGLTVYYSPMSIRSIRGRNYP